MGSHLFWSPSMIYISDIEMVVELHAARGSSTGHLTGVPPRYKASKLWKTFLGILTITRYVYDLSAVQLEIEQGILSHQAKVMQKCILQLCYPLKLLSEWKRLLLKCWQDDWGPLKVDSNFDQLIFLYFAWQALNSWETLEYDKLFVWRISASAICMESFNNWEAMEYEENFSISTPDMWKWSGCLRNPLWKLFFHFLRICH